MDSPRSFSFVLFIGESLVSLSDRCFADSPKERCLWVVSAIGDCLSYLKWRRDVDGVVALFTRWRRLVASLSLLRQLHYTDRRAHLRRSPHKGASDQSKLKKKEATLLRNNNNKYANTGKNYTNQETRERGCNKNKRRGKRGRKSNETKRKITIVRENLRGKNSLSSWLRNE